jgi:uncharacterized membrane protein YphA (DoxX/SURF4 family)
LICAPGAHKKALDLGVHFSLDAASLVCGVFIPPRRHRLQKLFSSFPDGWPGLGLILLRLTVAFSTIGQGFSVVSASDPAGFATWTIAALAAVVGLALLVGLMTPLAGTAGAIGYLVAGCSTFLAGGSDGQGLGFTALDLAVMSIALVLLGPGAFSVDARLFGRREIIIPDGRRPPW